MLGSLLRSILDSLRGRHAGAATRGEVLEDFGSFVAQSGRTIYAESPAEPHISITRENLDIAIDRYGLAGRVLDVGCGQGMALERMLARGLDPLGINLGEDYRICVGKKLPVVEMDLNLMAFPAESFDGIWCRHALEHSIAPFFVIHRMRQFLKSGGLCYVEVPAPDTACHHETNENHYSVFTMSAWKALFARAGFRLLEAKTLGFDTPAGPDSYYAFYLRK